MVGFVSRWGDLIIDGLAIEFYSRRGDLEGERWRRSQNVMEVFLKVTPWKQSELDGGVIISRS